ncbi:hypothetical protein PQE71_gp010 [Bacillus phage Izhevsk]|uniref:Uncharacterized protein n=1 Tax=Bacillus phage Izhevsk TaxID=2724322 RepID=A0A6H0X616_9CAUD|nr:hypothetical protein PQE71_gp010 [Bacillus phage Izhevsk]QIW89692.1 hypothetical protein Izhevsk_10 [Bacillus phage Izhevsk]
MRNVDVLFGFVSGLVRPKTKTLRIEGGKLYNYNTVIAERTFVTTDGTELWNYNSSIYNDDVVEGEYRFVVNVSKYSTSTTTIQNQLLKMLDGRQLKCVADIPVGTQTLE